MCFSVALTRETIENDPRFSHLLDDLYYNSGFRISGFSFPGLPILRDGVNQKAIVAQWGLVPSWVRDPEKAKRIRSGTLNARWETVGEKPSFRDSWPGKRCLLPVEGFFEPHLEEGIKSTWYIRRKDGGLLYLGGIYQENHILNSPYPTLTFSILTLGAWDLLAEVHNEKLRMPLLLGGERAEKWLAPEGSSPDPADPSWCLNQDLLEASEFAPPEQSGSWSQGSLFQGS
ncbi:SOS response-associated peptidase [Oceanispirochaeta sp.]|jgi:putative SOS response-associated peptidase YedK|uniref:SOS response-associated peptidase n=1 Tax=Oceanispirochaeta sp. TaxID=2035350 RepID=UPI00262A47A6|nr:SOS response-associated peptidase [Oceanispirochaeta sp.]MDA3955740.1 SOS response-associated peptidase [Oceanispirochaeta sp.]